MVTSYLLDTDVCIDHLDRLPVVVDFVGGLTVDGLAMSVVSYMEIQQGILRGSDAAVGTAALRMLLVGFHRCR